MRKHLITRLSDRRFNLCWERQYDTAMVLDFNPLVEGFGLRSPFCLLHFQARPKGLRRWGIYDGASDVYYSLSSERVKLEAPGRLIQIPDGEGVMPTAVLLYDNSGATVLEDDSVVVREV